MDGIIEAHEAHVAAIAERYRAVAALQAAFAETKAQHAAEIAAARAIGNALLDDAQAAASAQLAALQGQLAASRKQSDKAKKQKQLEQMMALMA
jgi:hypothetical protein